MKPENTCKNGIPETFRMSIFQIFVFLTGLLYCFHSNAQDGIKTLNDSMYYVYSQDEWNSKMCENVEKIMIILNRKSERPSTEGEQVLVYLMKSDNIEEIEPGIKLKPYLMIYKSDNNPSDFLREEEEEELKIEEWMYKLENWNVKDTMQFIF
ncbi:MAG: hypothetical protein JSV22_03620 [Bacteroidales bacterium]|nr:MAG: hypothetical protein JSV22_03620 [Bacteroidales bacterium]